MIDPLLSDESQRRLAHHWVAWATAVGMPVEWAHFGYWYWFKNPDSPEADKNLFAIAREIGVELEEPIPTPTPTVGFDAYPDNLLSGMRGNWTSGPFIGLPEAPGKSDAQQDDYIKNLVSRGYQWLSVAIVNGSTGWAPGESAPAGWPQEWNHWKAYDGFKEDWPLLEKWLRKLAAAKIVPILSPFQGAQSSWRMMCRKDIDYGGAEKLGYSNEWAKAELGTWAKKVDDVCSGKWIWLQGYEANKFFAAFDGNPYHRGPNEKWGWNAHSSHWAKSIKKACPHVPTLLHLLPNVIGPTPGEGGRQWTPEGYWKDGTACTDDNKNWFDGLAGQFNLDNNPSDTYFTSQAKTFLDAMKRVGKVFVAFEYARPWVNEGECKRRAGLLADAGVQNLLNGV